VSYPYRVGIAALRTLWAPTPPRRMINNHPRQHAVDDDEPRYPWPYNSPQSRREGAVMVNEALPLVCAGSQESPSVR